MQTSSLSRSRKVNFNAAFAPMYERAIRFRERSIDTVCDLSKRFSWVLSNYHVGLGAIISLTVAIVGILVYNIVTH